MPKMSIWREWSTFFDCEKLRLKIEEKKFKFSQKMSDIEFNGGQRKFKIHEIIHFARMSKIIFWKNSRTRKMMVSYFLKNVKFYQFQFDSEINRFVINLQVFDANCWISRYFKAADPSNGYISCRGGCGLEQSNSTTSAGVPLRR